jgi:hypothetical protein
MSVEWIEHKGKKILYIKYGGLSPSQRLDQIKEATRMIVETNSDKNLSLTDMNDCFVDNEFVELAKEQGKISLPLTHKAAIVGIVGMKKILLKAVNAFTPKPRIPFETIEKAKDWLVE